MFKKRGNTKHAQVWVETVIYTLIALVMIGTVITIVKPKIEESQDKAIIDQSLILMKKIDSVLIDMKQASGNQRIIELEIKKGNLVIDGKSDRILFEIESRHKYSEPGEDISDSASGIIIHTQSRGKFNNVTLIKDYNDVYNITYYGKDEYKSLTKAGASYSMTLLNKGQFQFTDDTESCTLSTVETDCTNSTYSSGYTKKCISDTCNYIDNKINIDIEAN